MIDLPMPLTPPDCDCTDLDGFMLNVERLMASELVALAPPEAVAAALFLWCRAWKQTPAASLPDDDRVLAAFARLPLARFRKIREHAMRGFVKCSDGRLYHRTLSAEACIAYERKLAFRAKRKSDSERLKNWRHKRGETRNETQGETHHETADETRFVQEGQGQGQGQGQGRDRDIIPIGKPIGRGAVAELPLGDTPAKPTKPADPWAEVYRRGREILGVSAGGVITNLRKTFDEKPRKVLAKLEDAAEQREPLPWINAYLWKHGPPGLEGIGPMDSS